MPVPIACRCRISNQKFRVPRRARAQVSQIAAGRCTNPRVVRRRPRAREVGRGGAVRIACIASARAQIYHPTASPRVPGWPNSGSGAGQNRQHRASGRAGVELRCTASVAAARACICCVRSGCRSDPCYAMSCRFLGHCPVVSRACSLVHACGSGPERFTVYGRVEWCRNLNLGEFNPFRGLILKHQAPLTERFAPSCLRRYVLAVSSGFGIPPRQGAWVQIQKPDRHRRHGRRRPRLWTVPLGFTQLLVAWRLHTNVTAFTL